VDRFQAQLLMLEMGERALFTAGYDAVLHLHTCDEEVTVEKVRSCSVFVACVPSVRSASARRCV
jgi:GTPase